MWTLLQRRRRASAGAPIVTAIDLARNERTELSATSLENAAAKIANALRSEFDAEPGTVVGLHLPQHWQRSAWCAGAWTAGCIVAPDTLDADILVASADRAPTLAGRDVAIVSMHPFGLPVTQPLPDGAFDVTVPVRQQPDAYLYDPPTADYPALRIDGRTWSQAEVVDLAATRALDWGLSVNGRLLATDDLDDLDAWLCACAVPLAAEASVILATGGMPSDALVDNERVTASAGPRR